MEPDLVHTRIDGLMSIGDRLVLISLDLMRAGIEFGMIIAWTISFFGVLVVKELWSSRINRPTRIAGTVAMVMLIGIVSVKVPDWAIASMMHDEADGTRATRNRPLELECSAHLHQRVEHLRAELIVAAAAARTS